MKKSIERPVVAIVIATGVASVVTQLVAIREFLSQFQGNEVVIALILFCWLVLGGAGTLLSRPAITRRFATFEVLCGFSLVLMVLATFTILGARLLRDVFFLRGASVGFYPTFLFVLAITTPYALLIGFLLPFSLFVMRSQRPDYPGALVYIWDSIGDISGGGAFFVPFRFSTDSLAGNLRRPPSPAGDHPVLAAIGPPAPLFCRRRRLWGAFGSGDTGADHPHIALQPTGPLSRDPLRPADHRRLLENAAQLVSPLL